MKQLSEHASLEELGDLIFGDENSYQSQRISSHVENCQDCRDRMEQLSGTADFDRETSAFLREPDETYSEIEDESIFVHPPKHPELFGRIGRYDIESVIGRGGMGIVVKANDTELNRPVAIKVLRNHLVRNGSAKQRFVREAKAVAAVINENVVGIYNVEQDENTPFLVMQYVAGESLQSRVDREGPLSTIEILRIGSQVAAGLAAAHRHGIVHRDIKPANILLEKGVERALVTDFGLAQTIDDASLTQSGFITGTPHYMAPEQAAGRRVDHRSDLFSLGSVLYFMAVGHPPFRSENSMSVLHKICHHRHTPVWKINPRIPDELCLVIDRLLNKKGTRRFSSARELEEVLLGILEKLQSQKNRRLIGLASLIRRNRPAFLVATITALVVIATTFIGMFLNGPSAQRGTMIESSRSSLAGLGDSSPNLPVAPAVNHAWDLEIQSIDEMIDELGQFD